MSLLINSENLIIRLCPSFDMEVFFLTFREEESFLWNWVQVSGALIRLLLFSTHVKGQVRIRDSSFVNIMSQTILLSVHGWDSKTQLEATYSSGV